MKARTLVITTMLGLFALLVLVQSCTKDAEIALLDSDTDYTEVTFRNNNMLNPLEELGKEIFFDDLSAPNNMSCATCHSPAFGFSGPNPGINKKHGVYPGAIKTRFGNRKPPSAAYATLSPIFYYDAGEGLYVGGNFWDGRATGQNLGNPAADQALGPFLNHVEQNMPDKEAVLEAIAGSQYTDLWEEVWGTTLSWDTPGETEANYDRVGLAIAAYEDSPEVNAFSSKYDLFLVGAAELTPLELEGMFLFFDEEDGGGKCGLCHPAPLFTDFTYDNLGTPRNPNNPWYDMDQEYVMVDGTPVAINPAGNSWVDFGLGGFLESAGLPYAAENRGKHKVPTLRNVDKRHGPGNTKAYMHNGVFKSLEEVVHFYNTRDVESWPAPEVAANVNVDELGDLGLSAYEEAAIVAFLKTLSDGY